MEIRFAKPEPKKTTVKFEEVVEEGVEPIMGNVYVKKHALRKIGADNPDQVQELVLELRSAS